MDHALAKELKDAGFPLTHVAVSHTGKNDLYNAFKNEDGQWYAKPTLEELIEACGERFFTLELRNSFGHKWECHHAAYNTYYTGESPIEAVARLWLALNHTEAAKS